jgi:hypothetical protein
MEFAEQLDFQKTYQEQKEKSSCHDGQLLKSVRQI